MLFHPKSHDQRFSDPALVFVHSNDGIRGQYTDSRHYPGMNASHQSHRF
ncbi:MAG TPA: hypothetical protein VK855_01520 [Thioalkalivibrio sp.]|nr:hypothetical protein [Thioalkalivibrio sp.]